MIKLLKAGCIALYLMALAALWVELPWGSGAGAQKLALVVVAVHAVELVFAFKYVQADHGPLQASILKTLLYGLLHWGPIAYAQKKSNAQEVPKG